MIFKYNESHAFSAPFGQDSIREILEKYSQPTTIAVKHPPSGKMAIDVYGQRIEPICNYRTCNHKFSTHGHSRKCKCRHLSTMLQEYHYNQKVLHLLRFMNGFCYNCYIL